ncbi:hypothetical protein FRACYDRAFT_236264 [Fragilariopsis cylindrus CCMP1102]|uniref:Uncharacterized protein n=1 Tax=Fragilariopsis cylindrus CCMP1102 TaxID=635003 RepID=A0A1E7FQ21_9STRA|nr:hypothetical protein FRACYDRAFT_236264 [Fragilariopsis cylindrus CCMP1102]|eukprot:OEU20195.1 hypothetical protein FRACYDRAFT_236264 [Fragilariopsis cylindrus CCMP1102]
MAETTMIMTSKAAKTKRRASSTSSSTTTYNTIRRKVSSMLFLQLLLLVVVIISVVILGIQMHTLESTFSSLSASSVIGIDSIIGQFFDQNLIKEGTRQQQQQQQQDDDDGGSGSDGKNEDKDQDDDTDDYSKKETSKLYDYDLENDQNVDEDLKPILKILRQGGYDISPSKESYQLINRALLPKWSEIMTAYGPPKILGLETSCQAFQNSISSKKRNIAPAGIFNTGTNLLSHLLGKNCVWEHRSGGNMWQPPWGKHIPAVRRTNHTHSKSRTPYYNTLPVVTIRDPYTWMQSMCRQNYAAQFDHDKSMCPNIIPYPDDILSHPRYGTMNYIPIWVKYDPEYKIHYDSLVHLWNEWYLQYIQFEENDKNNENNSIIKMKDPSFPFLMVRMEDLVFHGQTIVPQLCECAGAKFRGGEIQHVSAIANGNHGIEIGTGGYNAGLLRSVIKYGNVTKRKDGYPKFQLEAAHKLLDSRLMKLLSYPYEEP